MAIAGSPYLADPSASSAGSFFDSDSLSVVGGGVSSIASAIGAFTQAQTQKGIDQYQAGIAKVNQAVDGYLASDAIRRGNIEANNSELNTDQLISRQRTAMAANGVDLAGSASAQDVLASTTLLGQRDVNQIHDNALKAAWGYQVQGANAGSTSSFYTEASNQVNPLSAAGSSLLSSGGQVAAKWYQYNKSINGVSQ